MSDKKFPILPLIIVTALAFGGGYLYTNFGSLITRTAEKIASNALGVPVDIGSIDVSVSDKTAKVNSVKIGNPPGYSKPHAITAEEISIKLGATSKEIIAFDDIQVKGSVVNLEVNEKGMNLNDLRTLANSKKQKSAPGAEQIRVIIQHMVIGASTINPSITLLRKEIKPIQMPPVTISGMGRGGGVEAGDAIVQVLTKYLSRVEDAARDGGMLKDLSSIENVKKTLDNAGESIKELFK